MLDKVGAQPAAHQTLLADSVCTLDDLKLVLEQGAQAPALGLSLLVWAKLKVELKVTPAAAAASVSV